MLRTTFLNMKKPEGADPVNVQDFNENFDTLDTEVNARVKSSAGDISNTKITSPDNITTEFPVPAAGDTAKGFLGKMKKFCADFNSFKTGVITLGKLVNNGLCTESGYALDARMGKTLTDGLNQVNSDFAAKDISGSSLSTITRSGWYTGMNIPEITAYGLPNAWYRFFANVQADNSKMFSFASNEGQMYMGWIDAGQSSFRLVKELPSKGDLSSKLTIDLGGQWDGTHSADDYRSSTIVIWCHPSLGTLTDYNFPANTTGLFICISYSSFAVQLYATTGGNIWYRGTNISSAFPAWTNLSL